LIEKARCSPQNKGAIYATIPVRRANPIDRRSVE
jgi:hypothetical protein